jgi:hypothetical protein
MKTFFNYCLAVMAFGLIAQSGISQITTPAPSPFSKVEQKVGLTDVTIEYSRPSARFR